MHKPKMYLKKNTYPLHSSCIAYDFRSHGFQSQTTTPTT